MKIKVIVTQRGSSTTYFCDTEKNKFTINGTPGKLSADNFAFLICNNINDNWPKFLNNEYIEDGKLVEIKIKYNSGEVVSYTYNSEFPKGFDMFEYNLEKVD